MTICSHCIISDFRVILSSIETFIRPTLCRPGRQVELIKVVRNIPLTMQR